MAKADITLAPVLQGDYLEIARLESAAFAHEGFGKVAFGEHRLTEAAMEAQAKKLAQPSLPGESKRQMKAVATLPGGVEEIVGFAGWTICVGRGGSEEERQRLGTKEGWAQEDKEKEEKEDEEEHGNAKFREEVFGKGHQILARVSGGQDYMSLSVMVVLPKYQRKGIGRMLFEDGIRIADEAGLQLIIGASDQGIGLYKRYDCVEAETMHIKVWEYEGGEGLGVTKHFMMHRPAKSLGASSK
jgi:GNAT superfamily N-acetyltransferase